MTKGLTPASIQSIKAELRQCAEEPIHIPGAIQPHGALVALSLPDLTIGFASENLADIFPLTAAQALGRHCDELIGEPARRALAAGMDSGRITTNGLFTLSLTRPDGQPQDCHAHLTGGFVLLEFELAAPSDANDAAMESAQSVLRKLQNLQTLGELSNRVVAEVRRLTGYDRVMLYRFDPDNHGQVIAEEKAPEMEPYLDLRYPASDIPEQARKLYLMARVRVIPTVDYNPVSVLRSGAGDHPLDMSLCALRSVSPIHLQYLRNMGITATLAISIVHDQRLWGMIVAHHRTPRLPSAATRVVCDLVGQLIGLLIAEVDERQRLGGQIERRESLSAIMQRLDTDTSLLASLAGIDDHLLRLVGATGVFIRLGGEAQIFGETPDMLISQAILKTLSPPNGDEIVAVNDLPERHPRFAPWKSIASGVLVLPVANNFGDGIAWFRPEVGQTVTWGGDPNKAVEIDPVTNVISPRTSFAQWKEIVEGRSLPWTDDVVDTAQSLRRILARSLLRQTEAALFRVSNLDPLTGLANRSVLNQRLLQWRSQSPQRPACLLFLDLDRFKTVNDSLGHYAGDDLLRETAARLSTVVTGDDLLVRLGGDEFVLFCEGRSVGGAYALAEAVLKLFDAPFTVAGRPYRASTSIGIAYADDQSEDLLREADAAMYAAKRQGGNNVSLFQSQLHDSARNKLRTEQDLFLALERGELAVHYQPIVNMVDQTLRGYEALARWYHPERGLISPAEFIPLAEETGQIHAIGLWVMGEAIRTLAGFANLALRMSINVSAHQLVRGTLADDLGEILARHGVAPARVVLEVTESALMSDEAVRELERVRRLGCGVAIDDFGTGYSSLAHLRRLPVDVIKIDRSFIAPLGADETSRRFMEALVNLAHTIGLMVVAEGVETVKQWHLLTAMDCDIAQGYLFGRPGPDCDYRPAPRSGPLS
jgi:diguanylate cyclase (GGDEF)-like protein